MLKLYCYKTIVQKYVHSIRVIYMYQFLCSFIYLCDNQRSSGDPPVGLILLERCQVEKNPNETRPFCFSLRKLHVFL